jgi:predicted DNA-binding transcriptional regulator YafY
MSKHQPATPVQWLERKYDRRAAKGKAGRAPGAQRFRLAQARRLVRFYAEHGTDLSVVAPEDVASMLDAHGRIVPEHQDYAGQS